MEYFRVNGVDVCGIICSYRMGLFLNLKVDNEMVRGEYDCRVLK